MVLRAMTFLLAIIWLLCNWLGGDFPIVLAPIPNAFGVLFVFAVAFDLWPNDER